MKRTLLALLLLPALLALACATEESIKEEWDAFVEANSRCQVNSDCALVYPGCPLGCLAAVRADAVEEAQAYAKDLIDEWELGGMRNCEYDCMGPTEPSCDATGKCAVEPLDY